MFRQFIVLAIAFAPAAPLFAQAEPGAWTFGAGWQSATSSIGSIHKLDASAGRSFGERWQASLGVPFYFVSPSASTTAATGAGSVRGVGNVYGQLSFLLPSPVLNFTSAVTLSAPTGSRDKGLSTGHATVDWTSYVDRGFGPFTPFAEAGVANSVSDTALFVRPYLTQGFVLHGQAGLRYSFAPWLQAGASAYRIEPHGSQTVVSRVVTRRSLSTPSGLSPGLQNVPGPSFVAGLLDSPSNGVFETTTEVTGTASLVRDSGFSTWLSFGHGYGLSLRAGFTRSQSYGLNTVFLGAGYNLRRTF